MCALQSRRLLLAPLLLRRSPNFAARGRRVSAAAAGQRRRELPELEDLQEKTQACRGFRRFIADPDLAREVLCCLDPAQLRRSGTRVLECNPGPGILTQTLLDAGVQVAALERDKLFLPELQSLEHKARGQLDVVHCDFFRLDPLSRGLMKPPTMHSEVLFRELGLAEVPWTADVPVKIVGLFPDKNEKSMLWKLIYALYERISIFRYGRIELNMFISEKEYTKLIAGPGEMRNYQAISVLYQTACDMDLLLMEPWSSFLTSSKVGSLGIPKSMEDCVADLPRPVYQPQALNIPVSSEGRKDISLAYQQSLTPIETGTACYQHRPNDHLCLVRITPRRHLFSHSLTTTNSTTFVVMMKQCFARRTAKLITRLESWVPGSGHTLLKQLELPEDILTGHVSVEQYERLFDIMEHSGELNTSWIFNEILENKAKHVF